MSVRRRTDGAVISERICADWVLIAAWQGKGLCRFVWDGVTAADACAEPFGRSTPSPASEGGEGKYSPPDGLGHWPRKTATNPKPSSILAFQPL